LHYAGFVAFVMGLYHALNVGSDLVATRGLIFAGVTLAPVVWLTYARILMPRATPSAAPRTPAPAPPTTASTEPDRPAVPA
jgi:hypothetical protein